MPEQRHVAANRSDLGDQAIDSRTHLGWAFSSWTSVAENEPSWCGHTDLLWRPAFILAVVPLAQIRIDRCKCAEAANSHVSRARRMD